LFARNEKPIVDFDFVLDLRPVSVSCFLEGQRRWGVLLRPAKISQSGLKTGGDAMTGDARGTITKVASEAS
jgi:hypothetical protein